MSKIHGRNTDLMFNAVALEGFLTDMTLNVEQDTAETTSMGDGQHTFLEGALGHTSDISGFYDGAAGAIDATVWSRMGLGSTTATVISPAGGAAGPSSPAFVQSVYVKSFSINSSVKDAVKYSASFQGTGALARNTS